MLYYSNDNNKAKRDFILNDLGPLVMSSFIIMIIVHDITCC